MHITTVRVLIISTFLNVLGLPAIGECGLPFGIFPFLTTGWYYKPSPVESVVLGLIVVKVLAIRLASIVGILPIPYHLNDLFLRSLGKRSIPDYFPFDNLTVPRTSLPSQTYFLQNASVNRTSPSFEEKRTKLSNRELAAMYRLMLGLRRIDLNDCFLKTLCFMSTKLKGGKASIEDQQMIDSIRYLISLEKLVEEKQDKFTHSPVMDVYDKALAIGEGNFRSNSNNNESSSTCHSEYKMCPLSESAIRLESILTDLF